VEEEIFWVGMGSERSLSLFCHGMKKVGHVFFFFLPFDHGE
jgi:hypothetical protein